MQPVAPGQAPLIAAARKKRVLLMGDSLFSRALHRVYRPVLTAAPAVRANEALLACQAVEVQGTNCSQNEQSSNGQATHAHWWRQALYLAHGDFNESGGVRRN